MKNNNELLFDIIYRTKKKNDNYIIELTSALPSISDEDEKFLNMTSIDQKKEENSYLSLIANCIKSSPDGYKFLKRCIADSSSVDYIGDIKISKYDILTSLVNEYKQEEKKNYKEKKYIGLKGIFDNSMFCSIIKRKIDKYTNCNMITKNKYKHYVAFLAEFLEQMESSEDPLKTLKQKMQLYKAHRDIEFVNVRKEKFEKIEIIKSIVQEYKQEKSKLRV